MSFVNQNLSQNVAGGLGGRADAQLAEEARRNQVQPSKDIMVSRTSTGTFLTLREPKGGGSTTTEAEGHPVFEYKSDIHAARVAANIFGITTVHGTQYFYGEATLMHVTTPTTTAGDIVNWIGPPLLSEVAEAQSIYTYEKQVNGFFRPKGGTSGGRWELSSNYQYGEQILLGRMPMSLGIGRDDGSVFRADWVDLNNAGRIWSWVT